MAFTCNATAAPLIPESPDVATVETPNWPVAAPPAGTDTDTGS